MPELYATIYAALGINRANTNPGPKGVNVPIPLQAYFRINSENMGQFERTLIIVDEGAYAHYVEGCTAPMYSSESLHSAVVEVVAKRGSRVRYTTIQNWANNIYNLVTKRAVAHRDALVEWIDGNLGSRLTMKYPSVYMVEPGAKVQEDDELLVIEALKMENLVYSPCGGTVKEIRVKDGDKVDEDAVLLVIE